jgi:LPXTG-site transpeptidase (sortase) family protein
LNGGVIPAGGTCSIDVDITAPTAGPYLNITGPVSATNGGVGNVGSDLLLVGAALVIDPAVTKTGNPASASIGDTVTFTLNVFNTGNANAVNVVVTDTLPSFLDYVTVSAPGSASAVYAPGPHTVTITYATVQPTDNFTITITTVVNSSGLPPGGTNLVDLTSLTPDADPTNNSDSEPIAIVAIPGVPAPDTGFAPNRITTIPTQPPGLVYTKLGGLSIQIPVLGVDSSIVGVPLDEAGWDVTWLWDQVGYLDGTAFPGWDGNSVLTGHVYLPSGLAGPFEGLHRLTWGDRIIVDVYGTRYIYEVRESRLYRPLDNRIIRPEDSPWLTLITCQSFNEHTGEYRWRRVIRAVLIEVE